MLNANETEIPLNGGIKRKVSNYVNFGGGLIRMNTAGAGYYSFTPFQNEKGKVDFCGGWDWISTLPNNFSYVYDLNTGRFYTMSDFCNKFK